MKLSTRPIHGFSKIRFTHNRRGFLLVDAFAGAGFDITTSEFVAPDQILVRVALAEPKPKEE